MSPEAIIKEEEMHQMKPVTWISHRGYCQEGGVENTRSAFDQAVKIGFRHLETDLRTTMDGHLVLLHDLHAGRLGGPSTPIHKMSRLQVEKINLKQKQKILFFDEFANLYQDLHWTLDIKPENGFQTLAALQKWMNSSDKEKFLRERAIFLFWDEKQKQQLLSFMPKARLYASEKQCWRAGIAILCHCDSLAGIKPHLIYALPPRILHVSLYRRRIIDKYHKYGAQIAAYLPESKQDTINAIKSGCDQILTNHSIMKDSFLEKIL